MINGSNHIPQDRAHEESYHHSNTNLLIIIEYKEPKRGKMDNNDEDTFLAIKNRFVVYTHIKRLKREIKTRLCSMIDIKSNRRSIKGKRER